MKIRHQGIDGAEPISRADEQARRSPVGRELNDASRSTVSRSGRLETAHDGRADRDHPPRRRTRGVDRGAGARAHLEVLPMHLVLIDVIGTHRLEGSRADVQRDESAAYAAGLDLGQQIVVEVQPRRGCRDGAGNARIDRLVLLAIGVVGQAVDVGRQRHFAVRLEELEHARSRT